MPKIIQINGKVTIKREQRLLVVYAERSNFTESKVKSPINHVKIKTVSHCPWLRSFRLAWGLGEEKAKAKRYITFWDSPQLCINKLHKAFKIRLRLFLEDFVELKE